MSRIIRNLMLRSRRQTSPRLPDGPLAELDYQMRLENERSQFDECLDVHELPDIFHYWSNKYLVPMFSPCGFTNPWDFFFKFIREKCEEHADDCCAVVSIGSGNCDLEIQLAERLVAEGLDNFRIDCIEINSKMADRARERLAGTPVADNVRILQQDFNFWQPEQHAYHVVMANQSLHHVVELEHLFDAIRLGLADDGLFLVSDMIGRNGHQRWPEALDLVNRFWEELPDSYRYNRLMQRQEKNYVNHDCSVAGFEGIRAQDILPLLLQRFHFRLFLPYGNAVFVFIDRPFGHNFDASADWDRDFIDRVHSADERGFKEGWLKPTSMIAVLSLQPGNVELRDPVLTPQFCVRDPSG